uniref:DUF4228 domain-containing protein n=1 Tax=Oryza meridionalis TaxID=40149 RepID=A0A0E0E5Z2_9ORYZ
MGCAFSSAGALRPFEGVRVIHINGYVEDFDAPVTVGQVTGKSSSAAAGEGQGRYVLCSSAHLLQPGRGPFRADDPLEAGTVYFLLPQSIFQSESSAVDLACLMNRLTSLARKGAAAASSPVEALFAAGIHHPPPSSSPCSRSSSSKPPASSGSPERCYLAAAASRPAAWKPRLDRIDESFGRASMRSSSARSTEA